MKINKKFACLQTYAPAFALDYCLKINYFSFVEYYKKPLPDD